LDAEEKVLLQKYNSESVAGGQIVHPKAAVKTVDAKTWKKELSDILDKQKVCFRSSKFLL